MKSFSQINADKNADLCKSSAFIWIASAEIYENQQLVKIYSEIFRNFAEADSPSLFIARRIYIPG